MSDSSLNQKGFTLVELVIAISIAGSIVVAAAAVIFQLITVPERNSNHMTAYTQVQNAGFSVSRDAVQAYYVKVDGADWLTLDWVDWEGDTHEIVYTLEDASDGLKELWRTYSYSDNGTPEEETMLVARYIDPGETNLNWEENVLTLVITAQVGDESATRTYNIEPRPLS